MPEFHPVFLNPEDSQAERLIQPKAPSNWYILCKRCILKPLENREKRFFHNFIMGSTWGIFLSVFFHNTYNYHPIQSSLVAQIVKNLPGMHETQVDLWVRKIPWRMRWQPTPVFLPEKSHGQRSLAGYSPWGHKGWTWLSNWTTRVNKFTTNSFSVLWYLLVPIILSQAVFHVIYSSHPGFLWNGAQFEDWLLKGFRVILKRGRKPKESFGLCV